MHHITYLYIRLSIILDQIILSLYNICFIIPTGKVIKTLTPASVKEYYYCSGSSESFSLHFYFGHNTPMQNAECINLMIIIRTSLSQIN